MFSQQLYAGYKKTGHTKMKNKENQISQIHSAKISKINTRKGLFYAKSV